MPLLTWDKATLDSMYDVIVQGVRLGYSYKGRYPLYQRNAQLFWNLLNLTPTDKVVVVGCGFGLTLHALNALGIPYPNMLGIDTGDYIQTEQSNTNEADINTAITNAGHDPSTGQGAILKTLLYTGEANSTLNGNAVIIDAEDVENAGARNRINNKWGGSGYHVVTEDVLPGVSDPEAVALTAELNKLSNALTITHVVTTTHNQSDTRLNWKTIDEWKTLINPDGLLKDKFIDVHNTARGLV